MRFDPDGQQAKRLAEAAREELLHEPDGVQEAIRECVVSGDFGRDDVAEPDVHVPDQEGDWEDDGAPVDGP